MEKPRRECNTKGNKLKENDRGRTDRKIVEKHNDDYDDDDYQTLNR